MAPKKGEGGKSSFLLLLLLNEQLVLYSPKHIKVLLREKFQKCQEDIS